MSGYCMWFKASPGLRRDAERFLERIHSSSSESLKPLLQRILGQFIDECLGVFFSRPAEKVGLGPVGKTIVNSALNSIRRTIQLVARRLVNRLSNQEMAPLAEYIESILYRNSDEPEGDAYVGFAIQADLAKRLFQLQEAAQQQSSASLVPEVVSAFQAMTDEALNGLFEEPIAMLKLGPVLSKLIDVANETTRAIIHAMLRRTFNTMDDAQMNDTLAYFCDMIRERPQYGVNVLARQA